MTDVAVSNPTDTPADGPNCQMEHILWTFGSLPCVHNNRILACKKKDQ
jgi:hypothetical protein